MTGRDIAGQAVKDILDATDSRIDIRRVLRAILKEFGGELGFAAELRKEFDVAQNGSATRSRILLDTLKLINAAGDDGDSEELSVEDIEAQVTAILTAE